MSSFKLEFECDNDAFQDNCGIEIGCILQGLAKKATARGADITHNFEGVLRDTSGNTVGKFSYQD